MDRPLAPDAGKSARRRRNSHAKPAIGLERKSLRHNFSWTFFGNAVNAACQWLLLALMAKLGDAATVGLYAWSLAIVMPIVTTAMLQLRTIFITEANARKTFGQFMGIRLGTMGMALLSIGAIGAIVTETTEGFVVLTLVGLSRVLDAVSDLFRSLFQRLEQMQYSGISMTIRGITAICTVGVALALTGSLAYALAALCVGWLGTTLSYELPVALSLRRRAQAEHRDWMKFRPHLCASTIWTLLPAVVPMGLVMGLIALQSAIPRLFIQHFHDKAAVGYFAAIVSLPMAGGLVVGALGQSAMPRLAQLFIVDRSSYFRLLGKLLWIGCSLGGVGILFAWFLGEPILRLVFAPDFSAYHRELIIMCVAGSLLYLVSFFGYALSAARMFRVQPVLAIIPCIVAAAACSWLVPQYEVYGAAVAALATAASALTVNAFGVLWHVVGASAIPREERLCT